MCFSRAATRRSHLDLGGMLAKPNYGFQKRQKELAKKKKKEEKLRKKQEKREQAQETDPADPVGNPETDES